ncbi:glutamate receptor ionotropic, delta-1-like [Panulirus ornatus]|uniref:glutamate receptor ionotropic, delta-1-like n=1 Tax=Panulirus ornatus TaxID=150431 RepID=UPI003A84FCE4
MLASASTMTVVTAAAAVVLVVVQNLQHTSALSVSRPQPVLPVGGQRHHQQQEEEQVAAHLLAEVAGGRLASCHAILLTYSPSSARLHYVLGAVQRTMTHSFLVYDVETFVKNSPPELPILGRRPPHSHGTYCIAFYILAPLSLVVTALTTIPKSDWFPGAIKHFVCYPGTSLTISTLEDEPSLLEAYNTLYVGHNPHYLPEDPRTWHINLLSNCPFCPGGRPEIILRNRWSPGRGFQEDSDLFPNLFLDFNGHTFRAVTNSFPPFSHYSSGNSTHPLAMEDCLDKRIVDAVAKVHNFSYQVFEPEDGLWGYQLENGSFTGVLGEIQHYKADFSLDLSITAEREEVIDYTIGYHWEPLTFVTSKPQPLPQWLALVRPYQAYVWLCFLLLLTVAGPIYWLLQKLSGGSQSLGEAAFLMYASMFAQGRKWPSSTTVRLYSVFWLLFCLVVTVSYVSNLTAFLTVPALSPTVDTLEELVDSNFVWGINDFGAADYQLFKTSKVPLYQEIFRGLTFCPSLVECIQQALDERFAFISFQTYLRDAIAMHFIDKNGDTQVYLAKGSFFPADTGFAVHQGSPMKRVFDRTLRRLLEGGFVSRWMMMLIEKHTLATRREASRAAAERGESKAPSTQLSLTMYHLQGVFLVYAAGLLLCAILLTCEVALHGLYNSRNK